jgi:hypothetical protein
MNFKTTGLLVALVVLVGAIWFFFPAGGKTDEAPAPPPGAAAAGETKAVFENAPKDEAVARVELTRPDKPALVFEKVAGSGGPGAAGALADWRMVAPRTGPADANTVMGLVRTLTLLQSQQQLTLGERQTPTLAELGLEKPTTLVIGTDDGKQFKLEIGGAPAMSNDTYVRQAGEKTIHVVQRDLRPQVDKTAKDFRSKRIIKVVPDQAVQILAQHEGQTIDLSRPAGGEWIINQPLHAPADGAKVRDKLLNPLNTLTAAEFVEETGDAGRFGFEQPFLTLAVTTEVRPPAPPAADSQPAESQPVPVRTTQKLVVGGFADLKSEKRYVQVGDGDNVVVVAQTALTPLVPNLGELRDPRVTRVTAASVTELELTADGQTATLKKVDGQWQGAGDLATVDNEALTDVLSAFETLSAVSYIDQPEKPATYGLDAPRATLKATASGQLAPVTLLIGSETASGRNAYVQRAGEPTVIVTAAAQAKRLAVGPAALRTREIFTFPLEQVQGITVQRGKEAYELTREGEMWKLKSPTAPTDVVAARALAADLSRLRAQKIVGAADAAKYGLDQPEVTVQFTVAPPAPDTQAAGPLAAPASHTLKLATRDGTTYAQRDNDPTVFALDETVRKALTAELIDPRLFSFKPEEVQAVKIVGTGGTLELARVDKQWKYVPEPFIELNQQKVTELVKDLTMLRAEAWLNYAGGDLAAAGLDPAPASVTLRLTDGAESVLRMAPAGPGQLPRKAGLLPGQRVLLLKQADAEKILRGLDDYVKSDKPETPPQGPGGPPGGRPPVALPPGFGGGQ